MSQICTTREQSERLLVIGLKPETADMVWHYTNSRVESMRWELNPHAPTLRGKFWNPQRISKLSSPLHKRKDGTLMSGEEVFDEIFGKDVPAWSLSRLLEMLPKKLCIGKEMYAELEIYTTCDGGWRINYPTIFNFKNESVFEVIACTIERLIETGYLNYG